MWLLSGVSVIQLQIYRSELFLPCILLCFVYVFCFCFLFLAFSFCFLLILFLFICLSFG